jgi:hypothetical protein
MITAKRLHEIWETENAAFSLVLDKWLIEIVFTHYFPGQILQLDLPDYLQKYPFSSVLETLRKRGFKCNGWSPSFTIDFDFT